MCDLSFEIMVNNVHWNESSLCKFVGMSIKNKIKQNVYKKRVRKRTLNQKEPAGWKLNLSSCGWV